MGIVAVRNLFKKLASQWNNGFFYVVDGKTLKMVLEKDIEFSKKNKLEAINEFYLYLDGKQHHVMVWDYSFSSKEEERKKGLYISYDEEEFHTLEEFYQTHIEKIPGYFMTTL